MSITGATIKDAVISKLASKYPSIIVIEETIQQGSTRPYLFVSQIDMTQWKESTNKYRRLYQMKVIYKVAINDPETNAKLDAMGAELMEVLDTIDVEAGSSSAIYPVYGRQMDYKIVDDMMQFFVSYPIRIAKQLPHEVLQETLTINTNTKTEE